MERTRGVLMVKRRTNTLVLVEALPFPGAPRSRYSIVSLRAKPAGA